MKQNILETLAGRAISVERELMFKIKKTLDQNWARENKIIEK